MEPTLYSLDLGWLLQGVATAALAVVSAVGGRALKRLGDRLGLEKESLARQTLQDALTRGLAYAQARIAAQAPAPIQTRHPMVAEAAVYLRQTVPDALRRLGVTEDSLRRRIEAELANREVPS